MAVNNTTFDEAAYAARIRAARESIEGLRAICRLIGAAKDAEESVLGQTILDQLPVLERWSAQYRDEDGPDEDDRDADDPAERLIASEFDHVMSTVDAALNGLRDLLAKVRNPAERPIVASYCADDFDAVTGIADQTKRLLDKLEDDDDWQQDWVPSAHDDGADDNADDDAADDNAADDNADDEADDGADDGGDEEDEEAVSRAEASAADRKAADLSDAITQSSGDPNETQQQQHPQHTTDLAAPPADDEPLTERERFRDEYLTRLGKSLLGCSETEEGELDYAEACQFDYLIERSTFSRLRSASEGFKPGDRRAPAIAAEALIAAGAPLRRCRNGRFAFDGLRWRTDNALATFSAWWEDACPRITGQVSQPLWLREVSAPACDGDYEITTHTERHYGPPSGEERKLVAAGNAILLPLGGGIIMVRSFRYDGLPWSDGMQAVFEQWRTLPHKAMEAVFKALPEEEPMIEDAVEHLSTPHGLLRFNHDGVIDRYVDSGMARRMGITRMTAPLPELPADANLFDLDWRQYAPGYAEALDLALPPHMANYFQRLLGYTALGTAHEKLIVLLWGEPDTLKSTLLAPAVDAMGLYATVVTGDTLLKAGSARDTLAGLRGMRMVMVPIRRMLSLADADRLERLTGGVPHSEGWTSQAVVWAEARTLPKLLDIKPLERRLRVFKLDYQLSENGISTKRLDRGMIGHIRQQELPGVLLFVLQGAQEYLLRGLDDVPLEVRASTVEALVAGDLLPGFVRMLVPSDTPMLFATVYDALAALCLRINHALPGRNPLSAELKRQGIVVKPGHARKTLVYARFGGLGEFALPGKGHMVPVVDGESPAKFLPAPEARE